jgi:hypothetical protein
MLLNSSGFWEWRMENGEWGNTLLNNKLLNIYTEVRPQTLM